MYDAAVGVWQELRLRLGWALDKTNTSSRDVWKSFWAAQQRFFKLLCVSLKVWQHNRRRKRLPWALGV